MNRRAIIAVSVAVVVAGVGSFWAYESYQERQRMEAWETLLKGDGCDECAARKASVAKKQEERKAKEAGLDAQSDTSQ